MIYFFERVTQHRLGVLGERKDHSAALRDNLPTGGEHTSYLTIGLHIDLVLGIDRRDRHLGVALREGLVCGQLHQIARLQRG